MDYATYSKYANPWLAESAATDDELFELGKWRAIKCELDELKEKDMLLLKAIIAANANGAAKVCDAGKKAAKRCLTKRLGGSLIKERYYAKVFFFVS